MEEEPTWRGERKKGSGAPRKTTATQDKEIEEWVLENRGLRKVTVKAIRKQFPYLRRLSTTLVEERLEEAELGWQRRRNKSKVGTTYLAARIEYCHAVKRKWQDTLEKWAYTDGTVYYLDRTAAEHEQSLHAALGKFVWRRLDGKDALWQDCIAPCAYSKGQGTAVRVWGMLALGRLHIYILDEKEHMNQEIYSQVIEDHFYDWMGNCTHLVCDYEHCLRTATSIKLLKKAGLELVPKYPRCSQDFNAIENVWGLLKVRLEQTMPINMESREQFITRLRAAVSWANTVRADTLWSYSTNQKERAEECLATEPPGGRTSW